MSIVKHGHTGLEVGRTHGYCLWDDNLITFYDNKILMNNVQKSEIRLLAGSKDGDTNGYVSDVKFSHNRDIWS